MARPIRKRRSDRPPSPGTETAAASLFSTRTEHALWATLVVLALARATLAFVPSMWVWGLNLQRFLSPLEAWGLWVVGAAALVPALANRLEPWGSRIGDRIAGAGAWPYAAFALAGLLVWLVPDRLYFVGDFLVRYGAAARNISTSTLFPQAQPLDLMLHYDLPRLLMALFPTDILGVERATGALEAAAFAALAVALARALDLRGSGALAACAIVLCGGYLGLFTGYGKANRELCVLVLAVAVFGAHWARSGRGLIALGVTVAVAMMIHRSGLALLPALAVAWWIGLRPRPGAEGPAFGRVMAGIAIPLVALASLWPNLWKAIRTTDPVHLAPAGGGVSGTLAAAFAARHLLDVANMVFLLSPAWLLALVAWPWWRRLVGERDGPVLLALASSFTALLLFIHPRQGMFRDWDVFSPAAVAISILVAAIVGRGLTSPSRPTGLGIAVTLAVLAPSAQWLLHNHDLASGVTRARAYLDGPPAQFWRDRTLTWEYLGARLAIARRLDPSAEAYAQAATITPSPRLLYMWAKAEAEREHYTTSRDVLIRLTKRADTWPEAWAALAFVNQQLRDTVSARGAAERALDLDPDNGMANEVMQAIGPRGP